jgi:hypothetical protein
MTDGGRRRAGLNDSDDSSRPSWAWRSDDCERQRHRVGMAIRVPDAANPQQFWSNLKAGVESVRHYTDDELIAKGVPPSALADPNYVRAGIPLQDLDQFDPEFFGFSPKEAGDPRPAAPPVLRGVLGGAGERRPSARALRRADRPVRRLRHGRLLHVQPADQPELVDNVGLFLLRHTGNDKDFLVTRVSYAFDLQGPSVNVQTACSTSLVATHLAVQSLLSGECDMALAGGVTIEVPHGRGYHYKEGEVLSPDGHCRAFDHRSKGTVFGSGAGVVVLRRLGRAARRRQHPRGHQGHRGQQRRLAQGGLPRAVAWTARRPACPKRSPSPT